MSLSRIFNTLITFFTLVSVSYAGPTTNLDEYNGDKLLSKEQQFEFQRLLDKGLKHFEAGQYSEAEKDYKEILVFAPKKNLAYFNLGLTKYKQGEYKEAISYFDTVLKKRSYYVGAAFYYKAISLLNLEQTDEALKTAKRFTSARFFYGPSQSLIKSIKQGSDEYLDNANVAFADQNFELCLLEIEESVFADTKKGKELTEKCKGGLIAEEKSSSTVTIAEKLTNRHTVWVNTKIQQTNNIYEEATNTITKYLYNVNVGADYVVTAKIDYGIGLSYDHSNANDLPNFKDELWNIYVPFFYRNNDHNYSAELFYNHSKFNGADAWSEAGAFANYFYSQEKYIVGIIGSTSTKTSLDSNFDYKSGPFTSFRLTGTRYFGAYMLTGYVGADQNLAGDQPLFSNYIPYGNKSVRFGATGSFDYTEKTRISLKANSTKRDYLNIVSANQTDRDDTTTSFALAFYYQFNKNVKAYIEQAYINNNSNYGPSEVLDKNYNEVLTTLGLNLKSY